MARMDKILNQRPSSTTRSKVRNPFFIDTEQSVRFQSPNMSVISTLTRRVYVDPDFPNPGGPWDTPVIIYGYTPNFALAVFSIAWFLLLLIAHLFLTIRQHSWYWIVFPIGLLFEVVGYAARCLSAKNDPYNLLYFILNYFFIVTAPVFLAAGIYTVLSGLVTRDKLQNNGQNTSKGLHSRLPPKLMIWFFVVSDVISTIVQVAGAALVGISYSKRKDPTTANNILLAGLAYQVFSMGVFVILLGSYLLTRFRSRAVTGASNVFCAAFGVATVAVYLRTCFRLAETAEGLGSNLSTKEIYFACLEFAPIALAVLLLAVWHPGRCVGSKILSVSPDSFESTQPVRKETSPAV